MTHCSEHLREKPKEQKSEVISKQKENINRYV